MCDLETKTIIHNNYHYKLIDSNTNEVLEERTVYNTANSGLYVTDITSGNTRTTTFRVKYKGYHLNDEGESVLNDYYSYYATTLGFTRATLPENIDFGTNIRFVSNIEYPASTGFVGEIEEFSLGSELIIYNEDHEETDRWHWSECSVQITKTESTILVIGIEFFITVAKPTLPYCYIPKINSILNADTGFFPTPAPSGISLSPLILANIPNDMKKIIPTVIGLPVLTETNRQDGTYKMKNPETTTDKPGFFFLPATGSSYSYDYNRHYNIGTVHSIVYNGIGARIISTSSQQGDNPIIVPVVRLNLQALYDLLQDETAEYYYFYGSIPYGCTFRNLTVNGVTDTYELEWVDPSSLIPITVTGVGIQSDDVPAQISSFHSGAELLEGTYYANYIFSPGEYWEPPSGAPVCPRYIYLAEKPHNVTLGGNINCTIQGKNSGDSGWTDLLTGIRYSTIYSNDETNYDQYRAVVSAPETNSLNYFVNSIESTVLAGKSYDPNVIRIGNSSNDYGQSGVKIPRARIQSWYDGLISDQSSVTNYTIGISINTNNKFYKAANSLAYLKYEVITSGISQNS